MKIAIIGAGNVGGTLGAAWAGKGHQIIYGARNPNDEKVKKLVSDAKGKATATTVPDAAAQCDVVLLATPWQGAREALQSAGNLAGKVVIDAVNPLESSPAFLEKGLLVGHDTSAGEQIAQWAKGRQGRQSLQHHRRNEYGQSEVRRPKRDDVHLRRRRRCKENGKTIVRRFGLRDRGRRTIKDGAPARTHGHALDPSGPGNESRPKLRIQNDQTMMTPSLAALAQSRQSRSAGFQTCCIADFQIGCSYDVVQPAGLETCDTALRELRSSRFSVPAAAQHCEAGSTP